MARKPVEPYASKCWVDQQQRYLNSLFEQVKAVSEGAVFSKRFSMVSRYYNQGLIEESLLVQKTYQPADLSICFGQSPQVS